MPDKPQAWFEMQDLRRRRFANAVWIPLRVSETTNIEGEPNKPGREEQFLGLGSVAIPIERRADGERLGWEDIGLIHAGGPYAFRDGRYKRAEVYQYREHEDLGVDLVIEQLPISSSPKLWHANQDLMLALNLLQEGDSWVRPEENFVEVIRQRKSADGHFVSIEIKAEFLRDYLAARGMALRLTYYRQRLGIFSEKPTFDWPDGNLSTTEPHNRFEARLFEIGGDGGLYGGDVAVYHAWRTDVDAEEDVPVFGPESDDNTAGRSATFQREGPKFYRAEGALWREEWIEPADRSERIRGDSPAQPVNFIVDAGGAVMPSPDLKSEDIGRWLWFDPRVVMALAGRRGGGLRWHTGETGSVWSSPDQGVHYGVNRLGLVTVYAYDVARLPTWQQRIWAGHNVGPDGGVSEELLDAQMRANPAHTEAPEARFPRVMDALDEVFVASAGAPLFQVHDNTNDILCSVHRFRAVDRSGLLALAKDVARLTADRIDISVLRKMVTPPNGERWRSLKSLEMVLATMIPPQDARAALTALVGTYDLRLGDAHLPSSEINNAFAMVGIDTAANHIDQGRQLLQAVVDSLAKVEAVLRTELAS